MPKSKDEVSRTVKAIFNRKLKKYKTPLLGFRDFNGDVWKVNLKMKTKRWKAGSGGAARREHMFINDLTITKDKEIYLTLLDVNMYFKHCKQKKKSPSYKGLQAYFINENQ